MSCHLFLSFTSNELPQTAETVIIYIGLHFIIISIVCIVYTYI